MTDRGKGQRMWCFWWH